MNICMKSYARERSVGPMSNNFNLEDKIKKELIQKADEIKLSDKMFSRIVDQIERDKGESRRILKDRISNTVMKRWIAISLCGILAFGGMMFTFSSTVRAAVLEAVNNISTIFVVEKIKGKYKIVEKSTIDPVLKPAVVRTSELSAHAITLKVGFDVSYPETLYGGFVYTYKVEGINIQRKVSEETREQVTEDMMKAIDNNNVAAFNRLSQYEPYRSVSVTYTNKKKKNINITMRSVDIPMKLEEASAVTKTKVGNKEAFWFEGVIPVYVKTENGLPDFHTKPKRTIKMYGLAWESEGVGYILVPERGFKISKKEAVKIAESFMDGRK